MLETLIRILRMLSVGLQRMELNPPWLAQSDVPLVVFCVWCHESLIWSWFSTRSLREQDVVSVQGLNAGDLASLRVLADGRNYL